MTNPRPAPMIVVAGPPGAGKTTVANLLAPMLSPVPAVFDKDQLFDPLVSLALGAAGQDPNDRESQWYSENVKELEYSGLLELATTNRNLGCPVMLVAPFHSAERRDLLPPDATLVWVTCERETLRRRVLERNSSRDDGKRADMECFLERSFAARPGPDAHVIHNNGDLNVLRTALLSLRPKLKGFE